MTTALATRTQVDKRAVSIGQTTPALTVLPSPAEATPLTVQQVLLHVSLIQQIMGAAMKEGEHFGKIPGCGDKPTLLKPGAEKLCLTFRLAPTYDVIERAQDGGHREYRVTANLTSILTQALIGQGVGACTTMEGKYRFRAGAAEPTDRPVPRAYWDLRQEDPAKAQELIGGKGFTIKKVEGQGWMIAKGGEKVEHDNPADHFNTVLKMAKKRALVDAVLTATAASDIFTQDLEEISASIAALAPASAEPAPVRATVIEVPAEPAPVAPSPAAAPAAQADGGGGTRPPTAAPVAAAAAPEPDPAPVPAPAASPAKPKRAKAAAPAREASADFRLTPIHFGKNRGIALGLLTPQQIHWYETEWMPRWEGTTNATAEDRRLMDSLKAYRVHRNAGKARKAAEAAQPAEGQPAA